MLLKGKHHKEIEYSSRTHRAYQDLEEGNIPGAKIGPLRTIDTNRQLIEETLKNGEYPKSSELKSGFETALGIMVVGGVIVTDSILAALTIREMDKSMFLAVTETLLLSGGNVLVYKLARKVRMLREEAVKEFEERVGKLPELNEMDLKEMDQNRRKEKGRMHREYSPETLALNLLKTPEGGLRKKDENMAVLLADVFADAEEGKEGAKLALKKLYDEVLVRPPPIKRGGPVVRDRHGRKHTTDKIFTPTFRPKYQGKDADERNKIIMEILNEADVESSGRLVGRGFQDK